MIKRTNIYLLTTLLVIVTTLSVYAYIKFKYIQRDLNKLVNHIQVLDDRLYNESFDNQPSIDSDNLMNELTIIIPSFDKYSELWNPFFNLLFKNWPELLGKYKNIPIILVSNFEKYDENPRVKNIKVGPDISWSDNLISAMHYVNTKYVLIMLEDYMINSPVKLNRMHDMLNLLEINKAAYAGICLDDGMFEHGFEKNKRYPDGRNDVIIRSKDKATEYRTSLQPSIWNAKTLKKILVPGESAWDFEVIGNIRSKRITQDFYMVVKDAPISYLNAVDKRSYIKSVIDYINKSGIEFAPKKLPIKMTN